MCASFRFRGNLSNEGYRQRKALSRGLSGVSNGWGIDRRRREQTRRTGERSYFIEYRGSPGEVQQAYENHDTDTVMGGARHGAQGG